MTKHDPVDAALKCPISMEDAGRIDMNVVDLMAENLAKLYNPNVFVEEAPKVKTVQAKKPRASRKSRLSRATHRLYNLESGCEPEKTLHIELDLYQMENY